MLGFILANLYSQLPYSGITGSNSVGCMLVVKDMQHMAQSSLGVCVCVYDSFHMLTCQSEC